MFTLTAHKRELATKPSALRRSGSMPAIVYGPKQPSIAIAIERASFEKVFKEAGESSVIELFGPTDHSLQVLVHHVDLDPVTSAPRHADFYAIEKGMKLEVEVPLVFIGESAAVKAGANLVKVLHELSIEADAAHLPHELSVDISVLAEVGDRIHAKDIALPAGVVLLTDAEEVVALAQEVAEVEEETVSADLSAIEVEKKGKEEEAEVAE